MSLRSTIHQAFSYGGRAKECTITHYGKIVVLQATVNATANLWYRTHFPEPRVVCPDLHGNYTLAEYARALRNTIPETQCPCVMETTNART